MQTSPCSVSVYKMMLTSEVWYLSIWYRLQKPDVWVSDADFRSLMSESLMQYLFQKSDVWVSDAVSVSEVWRLSIWCSICFRSLTSEYLMQYLFQKSDVWVLSNYRTERSSVVCVEYSIQTPSQRYRNKMFQSFMHFDRSHFIELSAHEAVSYTHLTLPTKIGV